MTPTEMLGNSRFPKIGELPYFLTLPAYGFFWFSIECAAAGTVEEEVLQVDLSTIVVPKGWNSVFDGKPKSALEQNVLPTALLAERWYGAKASGAPTVEIAHHFATPKERRIVLLKATPPGTDRPLYAQEVWNIAWESMTDDPFQRLKSSALARIRQTARVGVLYEASHDEELVRELLDGYAQDATWINDGEATLRFRRTSAWPEGDLSAAEIKSTSGEQSNTSIMVGDQLMLKLIRLPQAGIHPEAEIGRFFTEASPFANTPALYGTIEVEGLGEQPMTIGIVQALVQNQGDGWKTTLEYLSRFLEEYSLADETEHAQESAEDRHAYYNALARQLGVRTAEMHVALEKETGDPAFDPEPIGAEDRRNWIDGVEAMLEKAVSLLAASRGKLDGEVAALADRVLGRKDAIARKAATLLPAELRTPKTRLHGDYHLGQVLLAKNDYYLIDFEGEPARALEERRRKASPLKDVAGMLRSFDYAAATAIKQLPATLADKAEKLAPVIEEWRVEAERSFREGYDSVRTSVAPEERAALIDFFLLEKAAYEIVYEVQNRPGWLDIPLKGLDQLMKD